MDRKADGLAGRTNAGGQRRSADHRRDRPGSTAAAAPAPGARGLRDPVRHRVPPSRMGARQAGRRAQLASQALRCRTRRGQPGRCRPRRAHGTLVGAHRQRAALPVRHGHRHGPGPLSVEHRDHPQPHPARLALRRGRAAQVPTAAAGLGLLRERRGGRGQRSRARQRHADPGQRRGGRSAQARVGAGLQHRPRSARGRPVHRQERLRPGAALLRLGPDGPGRPERDRRLVPAAQRAGPRIRHRGQVQLSGHRGVADHRLERHRRAHLHGRGARVAAIAAAAERVQRARRWDDRARHSAVSRPDLALERPR